MTQAQPTTPSTPQQPSKSYGLFVFGVILLIVVDFLWTLSSVLVQKLLDEYYDKPIIITYCSTSVFALYVPVFYLSNWVRTFFYSCRIKRALREKYQDELSHLPTETTSLIPAHSQHSSPSYLSASKSTKKNTNNNNASDLSALYPNSAIQPSNTPYNNPSILPYTPTNQSIGSVDSSFDSHDSHFYNIDDRIKHDMEYLEGVHADKDSQLYNDIRSYRVLSNERGWKVFKHNFKTALVVGPLWYTMNVTYNSALKMVSVSTNTILSTTAGFFVLLIGFVVFCIPIRKIHLLCVIVAIIGSFLVCVLGSADNDNDPEQPRTLFDHIVGHGLSILSAFLYGLYSVVIEYFTDKEKPLDEQKDSITAQRKEAENEEKEEERVAQMEAVHLYGFVHNSSTDLTRSHSINNGLLGSSPSDLTNVSVKIENHMTQTSADICDDHHNNFGFGVCNEQAGISTYDVTLDDSDDEEDAIPEVLPANYDPNNPKLITGLLFGCVGLINLVFAWPFIGLFHFSGFETLSLPDSRAIPMLVMNSFLGAAASDFLWANSVILTSPIIATLTIPGTIPIAMCYETFFLHKPLSLYSVLGSILIVASSSVVTIMQYFEDKKYDKMTKKMLDKRDEKKAKEKLQRQKYRERQRQLRQLEAINTIVDKNGDDTDENGNADDGVTQRNVHNNQQTNPQITPNSHHYSTPRPTIVAQ